MIPFSAPGDRPEISSISNPGLHVYLYMKIERKPAQPFVSLCTPHLGSPLRRAVPHLAEEVHHTSVDNEKDTATRAQTEDLGNEALVQRAEAFLLGHGDHGRPGPVVFGSDAGHLDGVLNTRLDHVEGLCAVSM